jgi:hypothetical protein
MIGCQRTVRMSRMTLNEILEQAARQAKMVNDAGRNPTPTRELSYLTTVWEHAQNTWYVAVCDYTVAPLSSLEEAFRRRYLKPNKCVRRKK